MLRLSWGYKIALLYGGFVAIIVTLVAGSMRQHFDLVSNSYYADEIAYQKVIDAGRNQSALSTPIGIHANESNVIVEFPSEFKGKVLAGNVQFYSPVNSAWDKKYVIGTSENTMSISRTELKNTSYTVKITLQADGRKYYQETSLNLYRK